MKPKVALKLGTARINKKYPEETMLPEDRLSRYLYQPGEQHGIKRDEQQTLSLVKIHID